MAPLYSKALIIGATSGIGEALAAKLISTGTKVIVTGRRQDRIDAFIQKHGPSHATGRAFDVLNLSDIPAFAKSVLQDNPDLDCVVVNSGIQRAFDFTKADSLDLSQLDAEVTTNYTSAVHLTAAFLPHLNAQQQGHLVYISATLGLVPGMIRTPNYNASKAALHSFIMAVRQQLKDAQLKTRIVEVFPPAVQTELHDEHHQPDLKNGGQIGMPLDAYTEAMFKELEKGHEQFAIGPGEALLADGGWEDQRSKLFQIQQVAIKQSLSKFSQSG
ncbi:hypothetical protein B0T10DRAFT_493171 [Thelonectria olida]|uniref:Uncharacterized protein n=1 Tax=Thelonectria olida TaxID=1576542 RepID=A0A9P8VXS6_9HYPO|nr:hypothetical protein B0T10DRAFT_493171 [Thelonectria olida]